MSTNRYVVVGGVVAAHVLLIYAAMHAAGLVKQPEPVAGPVLTYVELPAMQRPEPPAPKAQPAPPQPKPQVARPQPQPAPPKPQQPAPVQAPPSEKAIEQPVVEPAPAPVQEQVAAAPTSAPAAAPAAAEGPVSEPVFNAAYLNNPKPVYPNQSRMLREQGTVVVRVRVSTAGLPLSVELGTSSGHRRLDNAALDVVKRWRFKPAMRGKEAVEATVNVPVRFELQD